METKETFFDRFRYLYSPREYMLLGFAYALSKHAHRHDVRMNERDLLGNLVRYFEHPRSVALILIDEMGISDFEVICVALLHDVLEDSDLFSVEHMELLFGSLVARSLVQLTKTKENKVSYYTRLQKFGTREALLVKVADRLHNLRTLGTDQQFILKQQSDTRQNFPLICARLREIAMFTPTQATAVDKAIDELFSKT